MTDKFLGKHTARRMEKVLSEWANTITTGDSTLAGHTKKAVAAMERFIAEYPELKIFQQEQNSGRAWFARLQVVEDIQRFLRLAWDAPDLRAREWFVFSARNAYYTASVKVPIEIAMEESREDREKWKELASQSTAARYSVPPMTPFEQLLHHFQRVARRARRCQNSECPAPYFFYKKSWQKYCSEKCSAPAQREQKRLWWREHRAKNGGAS